MVVSGWRCVYGSKLSSDAAGVIGFPIVRFKEYSGDEAANVDLARPETIRALENIPMLLMYEVGAGGAHDRVIRHGRARNISRQGSASIK